MFLGIPHPRHVALHGDTLQLRQLALIYLPSDASELDLAAARLIQTELQRVTGVTLPISRAWCPPASRVIALGTPDMLQQQLQASLPAQDDNDEAYVMAVTPEAVQLGARTAQGRLWAAQTFRQLLRQFGDAVPTLQISDAPAMRYRGVLLDVARRKVPTMATLKSLVDTLSLLKLNMLQLQVEHTFRFRRHPHIGEDCGSLSCEDIMELDAHCKLRGIELVPMLQSFGHMRNILMLDDYRHLAENERLQWSLNPTDPASLRFMDELYEEYLPAFSSGMVNIGSDETFDLGRNGGKSNDAIAARGKGRVYFDFLLSLHHLVTEKYGKRVMCWGDVVLSHPELIPEIPRDLILLNWWYNPDAEFPQVKPFTEHGLTQMICTGTNGWGQVFNRVNWAWINVENFTRDGKAVGALGILNTDWGDGGHYNLLGNSYYSFAHGAEAGWAQTTMPRDQFEALLAPVLFGSECVDVVTAIHELGDGDPANPAGIDGTTAGMLFFSPEEDPRICDIAPATLEHAVAVADNASAAFHAALTHTLEPSAVADMAWAADALSFARRRTQFLLAVEALATDVGDARALLVTCEALLKEHDDVVLAFCARWSAGNRRSEIDVSLGKFIHGKAVMQAALEWLQSNIAALSSSASVAPPTLPRYRPPWKEDMASLWEQD